MFSSKRRHRARTAVAAISMLAVVAAACGDDDDSAGPATTAATATTAASTTTAGGAATTAGGATTTAGGATTTSAAGATTTSGAPKPCTGEPIKLTGIYTGSGPLSFASVARDYQEGVKAALQAINEQCASGRPIEINLCDDKSDPNESAACGRTAAQDGSLAIAVTTGSAGGGAEASGLPSLLSLGANQFDLTNANSYPATNAITQILGSVSAAAGVGIKDELIVAFDSPQARFAIDLASKVGQTIGVNVEGLYFPPETTDFAPIAAQISSRDPGAIGMIVPAIVPFVNALAAEGITPKDKPMFTATNLVPPESLKQLGAAAEGMYLVSQSVPVQTEGNAGIDQMLKEYQAAGINTPRKEIGAFAADSWSKTHILADAIASLPPDQVKALDSKTLTDAVVGLEAVSRPELAPFDLSKPAFPDDPALAALRIFSNESLATQVTDGTYKKVSDFQNVTKPFKLDVGMTLLATSLLSQTTVRFVLLGMATGALTALVGLGIVLAYRASGVLNFAAGALGAIGAFVTYGLRDDWGWPSSVAMVADLVGAALGALTCGVMALIRRASLLTKLIATLALLSAFQGFMLIAWGTDIKQPASYLPTEMVEFTSELRIQRDRLILIGIVLALAVVLRLVYSKTRFGLATSAVSENRRVAASAGWSAGMIELINFTVAGVLSAFAAIMLAPIVTLNAAVLSLSVLAALAAALVGRFSSFGITVAAALLIGVVQSLLSLFQPELANAFGVSDASLTGLPQTVPLVIILIYTVLSGRARLARGETLIRLPLPGSGRVSVVPLAVGTAVAGVLLFGVDSWAGALITTFGIAIVVCSVVVVSGYAGQLSLCQYALGGFGAWVAARMVVSADLPFELALVVGVVAAIAAGVVVALPALRTRGVNLAVATLALALLFNALIFTNPSATGGFQGLKVPAPTIFGLEVDPITHPQRYGAVLLVALVLVGLLVANVRRGRVGRRMLAVRSNERAAAALGISVTGVKLYAFGLGAGIAAIGGILLAFRQQTIQFSVFDVFGSILLVQYAVLGGLGWVAGVVPGVLPAPGGLLARIVTDLFSSLDNVAAWLAIAGAIGVIQMIRRSPDGLAALVSSGRISRRLEPFRIPRTGTSGVEAPAPQRRRPAAALEVSEITVRFGGVVAVAEVSFSVQPGEVVGLIGPNGAGKTTLLDVVTGFTRPQSGAVRLDGVDVSSWSPERRARAGIARSWQAVELFEELTVRDNLLLGCEHHDRLRYLTDLVRPGRQRLTATAQHVIDDFELGAVLDQRPSSLPQGHARLVGIARAIVGEPSILFLDEPAAGLGPDESAELAAEIKLIAQRHGIGVLVVEHDVPLLMSICDRIVALEFGRKIAEGTPAEISTDEHVIKAYLGEPDPAVTPETEEVLA